MKKRNWPRYIWISSIFILLLVILAMVMVYKIKYQYAFSKELYFYECDGILCVMEVKSEDKLMYSKYDCGSEECPVYKKNIDDNYVLLTKDQKVILYNFRKGKIISQDYEEYLFINQNYIIVTKNELQGVIDIQGNVTVPLLYTKLGIINNDYLTGYNLNYIIAKKEEMYGIISYKNGNIIEPLETSEENISILFDKLKEEAGT